MNITFWFGVAVMIVSVCVIVHSVYKMRQLNKQQDRDLKMMERLQSGEDVSTEELRELLNDR